MENNTAIIPTAYYGSIQQVALLKRYDEIIIEQYESFPKQTYRNRCHLMSASGIQVLSIPLVKARAKQYTKDVHISYDENWQRHHWRSIESLYKRSPFFEHYADYFMPFYEKKFDFLIDFNHQLLTTILEILDLSPSIRYSEDYNPIIQEADDFRTTIHPKQTLSGFEKPYIQVFSDKQDFLHNLSILDLIFNLGPEAESHLGLITI